MPALAWAPDGSWLATIGSDARVRLRDPASGAQRAVLAVGGGCADALALDATGIRLAAGSGDGTIHLWAVPADGGAPRPLGQWAAHTGMVRTLAFSPDGRRLASGGQDGLLKLWDPADGSEAAALAPGAGWVESLAFSPDGRLLVAGAIQGGVHVWTLAANGTPTPRAVLDHGRGAARAVGVSLDGRWLAAGADDGRVHLWALPQGLDGTGATALLGAIGPKLLTLAFDRSGERIATGDMDGRLRLWDLAAELPEPVTLEKTGGRVLAVGFDADGARLAATTLHGLRLWGLSGSDAPRALLAEPGHGERVMAVAASPDGALIASGDGDGGLRLWDAASGEELGRLSVGEAAIEALTFSSDGGRLASGDGDGSARVWDLSAGADRASLLTEVEGTVRPRRADPGRPAAAVAARTRRDGLRRRGLAAPERGRARAGRGMAAVRLRPGAAAGAAARRRRHARPTARLARRRRGSMPRRRRLDWYKRTCAASRPAAHHGRSPWLQRRRSRAGGLEPRRAKPAGKPALLVPGAPPSRLWGYRRCRSSIRRSAKAVLSTE